jgi:hypothetical protein
MVVERELLEAASKDERKLFKVIVWAGWPLDEFLIGGDASKEGGLKLLDKMLIQGLADFLEEIHGIYGFLPAVIGSINGRNILRLRSSLPSFVYGIEAIRKVRVCLKNSVPLISADKLHEIGITGNGVKIGIVDTGVDAVCSLEGKVTSSRSFVPDEDSDYKGHGTHVAGIAAGREDVYSGVAPGAHIISAKVLDREGEGDEEQVANGIMWAYTNGADIVNLSLGARHPSGPKSFLSRLCDALADKGVVVVAAAGNDGPGEGTINSPGSSKEAITVGAIDKNRILAPYSSRGPVDGVMKPDILAPGGLIVNSLDEGIISTRSSFSELGRYPDGCHTSLAGTSMATAHASGSAALILEFARRKGIVIKNDHFFVKKVLVSSARDLGYKRNEQGAGLIDVYEAMRRAESYKEEEIMEEEMKDFGRDLASILVPSAIVGVSSVLLGALIQPKKGSSEEIYAQVDSILNMLESRMLQLNEEYRRGIIPPDRYSEEMMRISSILLKLNELIKKI